MKRTYAGAGVDIDSADRVKSRLKKIARTTFRPEVLADIGLFGGLFQMPPGAQPVLVSSVDGVGTKLKVAAAMKRYDTVGQDLVNHCINDILCCGAEPLFFLDYLAMGRLVPERVEALVSGLAVACKEHRCALVGGETAEMPGMYHGDDFDLAGFIVGVVERDAIKDGKAIAPGDAVLGLPSSGLHTNGYSLVRSIFKETELNRYYPEIGRTLGEELLQVHRCFLPVLRPVLSRLKGLAHITGGGLEGNVPRVLPGGVAVRLRRGSWLVPAIFSLIQQAGGVDTEEMYRVFNMGVGMVVICAADQVEEVSRVVPEAFPVGEVVRAVGEKARLIFD
ncbi:MAG: phosphoribosylformylglycinamidine cyclo-ligase [Chloroflexi bacterium]|nr:phosphoribosylformylglycinamidine cyclo-ligase [Chloroflexota bacterium]